MTPLQLGGILESLVFANIGGIYPGTARAIWTLAFGRLPSGVGDDLAFGQMGHIEPQVHAHP